MEPQKSYGSVKFSRLKAAIQQIEDHYKDTPERLDDVEVTFEYLVGSFFPEIVKNIHEEVNKQYTQGYIAGLNAKKGAK